MQNTNVFYVTIFMHEFWELTQFVKSMSKYNVLRLTWHVRKVLYIKVLAVIGHDWLVIYNNVQELVFDSIFKLSEDHLTSYDKYHIP